MRRGLVVLSKLADNVFVGLPHSDHDPDLPTAPEPLEVGDGSELPTADESDLIQLQPTDA